MTISPSPKELIYNKAMSLLSRREHSSHELFLKLKLRFPEFSTEIKAILAELEAKKYLANQRYAEMIIRHRATQGYGPNYIRQELKAHQVLLNEDYLQDPEVIEAFFTGWLRKFRTRFKTIPDTALAEAKLMHYFVQRGFYREQIQEFLARIAKH